MQNDLISRSALIEEFIRYFFSGKYNSDSLCRDLREIIDNQPTAYNEEKVIAELEESKKKNFELYENAEDTIEIMCYGNVVNAYGDAIAKVRNGRKG